MAQDLLNANVIPPAIAYTSPELERYGTISEEVWFSLLLQIILVTIG